MRKFIISLVILILLGWLYINGVRFTPYQSLASSEFLKGQQIEIILSKPTHYGQAVLFENKSDGSFGVARLKRHAGFMWIYGGGSHGRDIKNNEPFRAAGMFISNEKGKEQYILGVKVANEDIKYIAIGKGPQIPSNPYEKYDLTLKEVKEMNEVYKVAEIKDKYTMIVTDIYSKENWTITAFDKEGVLIADKLFGMQPRVISR